MTSANKDWFLHLNGQPQGPMSYDQLATKCREGVLTRDTLVWSEGMPAWAMAKDVNDLVPVLSGQVTPSKSSAPPPLVPSTSARHSATPPPELSHLIELNPKDVDDRTSAIDPKKLKAAMKEASKALKVADVAEKRAFSAIQTAGRPGNEGSGSGLKKILLILPILLVAGGGAAVYFKAISLDSLGKGWLGRLTSPLPTLDDVSAEDYEALDHAARADLKAAGPQTAITLSTQGLDKPAFYVSSNLPDGTNLSFYLRSDPNTLISDHPVEIRFPLSLTKHVAKSRSLHAADGSALPLGEYTASIAADDEQPANAKALLAGHKLSASRKFFLGGKKDADYTLKLGQFREALRLKTQTEVKQASLLAFRLEVRLGFATDASRQLAKTTKKAALKKYWDGFNKKWMSEDIEPADKGYYYPAVFSALHELWLDTKRIHELQAAWAGGAGVASQVTELSTRSSQKLAAIKAKLDSLSKNDGSAAGATPRPNR